MNQKTQSSKHILIFVSHCSIDARNSFIATPIDNKTELL